MFCRKKWLKDCSNVFQMEIVLQEDRLTKSPPMIYLGERGRFPSITDIHFLSDTLLVAAHRSAAYVYLIEFNLSEKTHHIRSRVRTECNGTIHFPDMFTVVEDVLYIVCFSRYVVCVQIVDGHTLRVQHAFPLPVNVTYHGAARHGSFVYFTPSTRKSSCDSETIVCMDTKTKMLRTVTFPESCRIKSLAFFSDNRIVVVVTSRYKTFLSHPGALADGAIILCNERFEILDRHDFFTTHFDGVITEDSTFYATCANLEGGFIIKGYLVEDRLRSVEKIPVYDFPHGVASWKKKLYAYTSYATDGIYIQDTPF